jgi:hypothetical protein
VVRRVVRAEVAPDRAAISHLHIGDLGRDLGEDGPCGADFGRRHQRRIGDHRPELEPAVGRLGNRPQLLDSSQIDEHVGCRHARLHHVHERLPAGQRPRTVVL